MWMYFDFRTWFKMLRLAWREQNPRNRRRLLVSLGLKVPAAACVHAVCFFLDPILFPGLRRTPIRTPVFLVGHARSGTTLLHRLMSRDSERFSAFLLYELSFPSLLEKKLIRWAARLDRRWLGGALEARVKKLEERRFRATRDMHHQSFTEPEEDDGILAPSCASGTWIVQLPYLGELDFYHVDRRPERQRRRLMRYYAECVRRQLYLNGPGSRVHLSKNPVFVGRLESLIETFPDARIVVPFRNPEETVPSLLKLMQMAWRLRKWSDAEMQRSLRVLAEQSFHTYTYPLEVLARHPEVPHAIVDYSELVAEPGRVIERVYAELGFPITPGHQRMLEAEQQKARRHETSHRYSLAEFGLRSDELQTRLAGLYERFGWKRDELRAAWDGLIARLGEAREAIDAPGFFAPPATDRNLAEGYRYLLGFLHGGIARALGDPRHPSFRRAIEPLDKGTIDNADAVYLYAPIDGSLRYRVRGRAGDTRHWRGEPPAPSGRKAPQYVILETPSGWAGDSGSIAELRPGSRANGGVLDSSKLEVAPDGSFEILLAPSRPEGHRGNFLATKATRRVRQPDGSSQSALFTSRWLVLRELFHDWEREDLLDLEITCLETEGSHPEPLTPARAAEQLRRVGEIVKNQMRYWNEFYAVTLETYADMNGDGKRFMPRNDLNAPNAASLATGGGQATNVYAGGVFELAEDEALLIEATVPIPPAWSGFHLSNLWGESLDFANHQSSLNGFQTELDPDGVARLVVAHRDPGVPNWVDTTGLPEGFLTFRWTYSELPERLPETRVSKLRFDEIRARLPAGVRSVSEAERRERIRIRQAHVQRRYRHY